MRKQFLAGSAYFFNHYPDYKLHDLDYVVVDDDLDENYKHYFDNINKIDYFCWKTNTPKWHIDLTIAPKAFALDIGRFLIPGVSKMLGITIEDLKLMKDTINETVNQVGPKYLYNKSIYESYLENNDFILTQEQRDKAYNIYKKYREEYK